MEAEDVEMQELREELGRQRGVILTLNNDVPRLIKEGRIMQYLYWGGFHFEHDHK